MVGALALAPMAFRGTPDATLVVDAAPAPLPSAPALLLRRLFPALLGGELKLARTPAEEGRAPRALSPSAAISSTEDFVLKDCRAANKPYKYMIIILIITITIIIT